MSSPDAPGSFAGVVLAAGSGTRLLPLTVTRPKALCPVGGVPLVDLAVERARTVTTDVAVNVHAGRNLLLAHLERDTRIHASLEGEQALGTAGALGELRPWIDGRPVLVQNADAWCDPDLASFVDGWDGESIRLLLAGEAQFHPRASVVAALMPWSEVRDLEAVPTGLYEASWRGAHEQGSLEAVAHAGAFVDCGTVGAYLRANLLAVERDGVDSPASVSSIVGCGAVVHGSATESVIGDGAVVDGHVARSVVWDGAHVRSAEHLVDAVRFDRGRTILVRR